MELLLMQSGPRIRRVIVVRGIAPGLVRLHRQRDPSPGPRKGDRVEIDPHQPQAGQGFFPLQDHLLHAIGPGHDGAATFPARPRPRAEQGQRQGTCAAAAIARKWIELPEQRRPRRGIEHKRPTLPAPP
jgi:hypothetical protein